MLHAAQRPKYCPLVVDGINLISCPHDVQTLFFDTAVCDAWDILLPVLLRRMSLIFRLDLSVFI